MDAEAVLGKAMKRLEQGGKQQATAAEEWHLQRGSFHGFFHRKTTGKPQGNHRETIGKYGLFMLFNSIWVFPSMEDPMENPVVNIDDL